MWFGRLGMMPRSASGIDRPLQIPDNFLQLIDRVLQTIGLAAPEGIGRRLHHAGGGGRPRHPRQQCRHAHEFLRQA